MGWLHFAQQSKKRVHYELLNLHATAARGDPKELKKQLEKLSRDV